MPMPAAPQQRARGRPKTYTDRLFLKALVVMIVRRLHKVHELLSVLEQPTTEMQTLRALLIEGGRYPTRRTFERRLAALPQTLPAQIGCLGRAGGADTALGHLRAGGGDGQHVAWRQGRGCLAQEGQEAGKVPHSRIDTEAGWTKSGWHGWVYGWKLHLASVVADVWIPLARNWTPADTIDDGQTARELLPEVPVQTRFVLGDQHYNREELRADCHLRGCELVTSRPGKYPHTDIGVEVRRVFHKLRSLSMENFNEHFAASSRRTGQCPPRPESHGPLRAGRGAGVSVGPLVSLRT